MQQKFNTFLETEPIGGLMRKYSVPCIISLLVATLYNIGDQIFIANADYLGSYGNAANTIVYPLTVVALALAVMIGDGESDHSFRRKPQICYGVHSRRRSSEYYPGSHFHLCI